MAIVRANDVRHLVFGGGGGRGWAHIGAVAAMEEMTNKPLVSKKKAASGHIDGIAGASIGAFVGMCVALGATSDQIKRFARGINVPGSTPTTSQLLEDVTLAPDGLLAQHVVVNGQFETRPEVNPDVRRMLTDEYLRDSLKEVLDVERSVVVPMMIDLEGTIDLGIAGKLELASETLNLIRKWMDEKFKDNNLLSQFRVFTRDNKTFQQYFANLQAAGGLLPGYALRDFVERAAREFAKTGGITTGSNGSLTFRDLFDQQGVELAVTGTHLASRRGYLFSYRDTPDFGIVPAVCISMSFPFIFKPISVSQPNENVMPEFYTGRWSDGGMINNLPLRAFPRRGTRGLDPRTVAFNLYEAIDRRSGTTVKSNLARVLREYAGVFMDQPVNSQMELDTDQYQIVRLDTPGLGTFDMIWDERKVPAVIDAATATTRTYFRGSQNLRSERRPECFGVSIQWEKSRPTKKDAIDPQIFEAIARAQFRSYFSVVTPAPVYIVPYINEHRIRSEDYFSIDMIVGTSADPHTWLLIEAKSSPTAPLSAPQRKLHGLVALHGGVLLNKRDYDDEEWSPFVDQSELPARKVTIVTPSNLCAEFKRLAHDARSLYGPFPSARP